MLSQVRYLNDNTLDPESMTKYLERSANPCLSSDGWSQNGTWGCLYVGTAVARVPLIRFGAGQMVTRCST